MTRTQGGFSLIEVVIAAALLLLTVTAVTGVVTGVTRGDARLSRATAVDRVLWLETERLRTLPFCAATYPAASGEETGGSDSGAGGAAGWGASAPDAVAELFPHAQPACNSESDYFVVVGDAEDEPTGSFVTHRERDGVSVTRVAWFASRDAAMVAPEEFDGWSLWGSPAPPATTLVVRLTAELGHRRRSSRVVLGALPPELENGLTDESAGSHP